MMCEMLTGKFNCSRLLAEIVVQALDPQRLASYPASNRPST